MEEIIAGQMRAVITDAFFNRASTAMGIEGMSASSSELKEREDSRDIGGKDRDKGETSEERK